jgi:regulator of protease activity HflC (stomatin/prohibitin superfamily)
MTGELLYLLIFLGVLALVLATAFLRTGLKSVPEEKRVVLFRLGKCIGVRGPGLVTLIPLLDKAIWVDLHKTWHFHYEAVPVAGGGSLSCSVSLEGRVIDPAKSLLNVPDLETGLSGIIETVLKSSPAAVQSGGLMDILQEAIRSSSRDWGFKLESLSIDDLWQTLE